MSRTILIAANWKMEKTIGEAESFAKELTSHLDGLPACDLLICPPFFSVAPVAKALGGASVAIGVQDMFWEERGAYTGEISAEMIKDAGATHVLIGHSERRHVIGESNEVIARKLRAALDAGLIAVLCVGEKIEQREAGEHEAYVREQLNTALSGLEPEAMANVVTAYEPVWAIGTGKTATPEDAEAMHAFVRSWFSDQFNGDIADRMRILYGGSVKPDNAARLLSQGNIDGALIGGASLKVDSYTAIARAAA